MASARRTGCALALASALVSALPGCAVGPDYKQPDTPLPELLISAPDASVAGQPEVRWWDSLGDPTLTRLIEQAVRRSPSIRIAQARIDEARANYRIFFYDYFPHGQVEASFERQEQSTATLSPGQPRIGNFYSVAATANWEIDVVGRTRRSVEGAAARVQASEASLHDVQVSLIAEVARSYVTLRGSQRRFLLAVQNAQTQRETLQLTQNRLEAGRGNALDVARAQSQFDFTMASVPLLEILIEQSRNRLAVLTDRFPEERDETLLATAPIPETPPTLNIPPPRDLLRRRPDVRVAERTLAAFTADIGVATADLYPQISVSALAGYVSPVFSGIGQSRYDTFTIVPGIRWALFDLHTVRARIQASDARQQGALASFERIVLGALEDAENSLYGYGRQLARRRSLESNAQAADRAAVLARQRYRDGAASFLDVLDSERSLLTAQDQLAQTQQDTALALVAVFTSFGGGWEAFEVGKDGVSDSSTALPHQPSETAPGSEGKPSFAR
ncbi:efflux transporter outer membrane subunit [Cupriavidus sp. CV2]|uniref:efflux transporter outer membrane subunit n=1 Tax=Cupriavidus ulmosensis TaxID=3065913 RepID=UPI00296A9D92|nr:efflux transporter outer membrane subunit [Cupriavidus sp. CV2]MDW3683712.1 efflux transporter outer membrane subunit [Cupriavidus sp. CV2]